MTATKPASPPLLSGSSRALPRLRHHQALYRFCTPTWSPSTIALVIAVCHQPTVTVSVDRYLCTPLRHL